MTETQLGREGKARSRPEPEGSALTAAELALPPCTLLPHTMAVAAVGWQAPFPSPGVQIGHHRTSFRVPLTPLQPA
jgi:hypothetical protein